VEALGRLKSRKIEGAANMSDLPAVQKDPPAARVPEKNGEKTGV
jgi:hypothetical protein